MENRNNREDPVANCDLDGRPNINLRRLEDTNEQSYKGSSPCQNEETIGIQFMETYQERVPILEPEVLESNRMDWNSSNQSQELLQQEDGNDGGQIVQAENHELERNLFSQVRTFSQIGDPRGMPDQPSNLNKKGIYYEKFSFRPLEGICYGGLGGSTTWESMLRLGWSLEAMDSFNQRGNCEAILLGRELNPISMRN